MASSRSQMHTTATHGAAGLAHALGALRHHLPRVAHVVGQQHAAALDEVLVERPQRRRLALLLERRERTRRMREAAAAVEQAGNRVRQQRAAGRRPGHHVGGRRDLVRHQVQQVLREPPDGRRVAQQLVRVQVGGPVIAVAVVEVPVEHQHFVASQLVQRALADVVVSRPRLVRLRQTPPAPATSGFVKHGAAADDRRGHGAAQRPAVERRVLRLRLQLRRDDGHRRVRREDR